MRKDAPTLAFCELTTYAGDTVQVAMCADCVPIATMVAILEQGSLHVGAQCTYGEVYPEGKEYARVLRKLSDKDDYARHTLIAVGDQQFVISEIPGETLAFAAEDGDVKFPIQIVAGHAGATFSEVAHELEYWGNKKG